MVPPKVKSSSSTPPPTVHHESTPTETQSHKLGLFWALLSPIFLGTVPILAKVAYEVGVPVLTLIAFRTITAALILWFSIAVFAPKLIRSSTPAVIGSLIAGAINGIGSIFFYASLTLISASLGQLINITYLVFVTLLLRLAGQSISLLTLARTGMTILAIYLLTQGGLENPNWLGVGMMLIAALTYAIQLVLSQRIMLDIPAPTMTLYSMTAMAAVVSVAWFFRPTSLTAVSADGWQVILGMGLATALSRLTLFLGVKSLGSLQTALLGVLEVIVTLGIASIWLDERLSPLQWVGATILTISILLVRYERNVPRFFDWWQFIYRRIYR